MKDRRVVDAAAAKDVNKGDKVDMSEISELTGKGFTGLNPSHDRRRDTTHVHTTRRDDVFQCPTCSERRSEDDGCGLGRSDTPPPESEWPDEEEPEANASKHSQHSIHKK